MKLFFTSLFLFLTHQLAQKVWQLPIPWADNYLDPLLCMPILLGGYSWEQEQLWGRRRLPLWEILILTALLSFLFEWVFPRLSDGFTADGRDVLAYFAGAFLFWLFR